MRRYRRLPVKLIDGVYVVAGANIVVMGGGQNLERRNVERPIFRNLKIANIKITRNELFDNFIFEFNFSFFRNDLNNQNI